LNQEWLRTIYTLLELVDDDTKLVSYGYLKLISFEKAEP
jgi:hypothetical protein